MTDVDLRCGCTAEPAGHQRQCDYCGTEWQASHCPHDEAQPQCPECDVAQVVQLA
jgi:hypothetical protein